MTVKDLVKIIHKFDSIVVLELHDCRINFNYKDVKINKAARFQLNKILFIHRDNNFEAWKLTRILIQNESLRAKLKI